MENKFWITLITSLAAIFTAINLPKLWEVGGKSYALYVNKKDGNIKKLKEENKNLRQEINGLKTIVSTMNMRMAILIPLLQRKFKDDEEALEILAHFDLKANNTPAKT